MFSGSGASDDGVHPVLTQCLFLNFSEVQLRVDGVFMKPRRLDAVDVVVRAIRRGVATVSSRAGTG